MIEMLKYEHILSLSHKRACFSREFWQKTGAGQMATFICKKLLYILLFTFKTFKKKTWTFGHGPKNRHFFARLISKTPLSAGHFYFQIWT
jgi:hypothetical protein